MAKYRYLRGRLRELGMTDADLAHELGMAANALSHRMTGRVAWSADEMYETLRICDAPDEELHLYFPRGGLNREGQTVRAVKTQDAADEAAKHLSEFIRCVMGRPA